MMFGMALWWATVPCVAQDVTVFLGSSGVTDIAVGPEHVYWTSGGGVGVFSPGDSVFSALTKADGLNSNRLTAVAVDASGNLWLGTEESGAHWMDSSGAIRWISTYDGLPSNDITSVDASGARVWIGTSGGASRFEGGTRIETVSSGSGLVAGAVLSTLVDAQDRVWFGTEGGLSVRDGSTWTTHFAGIEIRALALDRNDELWAATASGVFRYDSPAWVSASAGLPDPDVFDFVLADTLLWAGSESGPAWFDESSSQWVAETAGLPVGGVVALAFETGVGLWAGVEAEGVAFWDGGWESRRPSSPATNYMIDMDIDSDGGLWCGTGSDGNLFPLPLGVTAKGLVRFQDDEWSNFRAVDSPLAADNVYRVARDRSGGVWMGTWGAGLLHFDPVSDAWDTLSIASGDLFSNHISALVPGVGREVWFAEYTYPLGGIAVVDSNRVVTHFGQNDGLPTIFFRSIAVDSAGRVWAGSYGLEGSLDLPTLVRLDTRGTFADKGDDELIVYSATSWGGAVPVHALACAPDGGTWIGVESGIAWTDGVSWLPVDQACAGGITGQVRSIAVDRAGTVWIAAAQGLGEWRDNDLTIHDTAGGGLAVDEIMSLAYDRVNRTLWIGTWGGGVSRWAFESPGPVNGATEVYAFPNPFRPDLGHERVTFRGLSGNDGIALYTLEGQEVTVLPVGVDTWAATDGSGEPVASGLYVFLGKDDSGNVRTGKIAIIR